MKLTKTVEERRKQLNYHKPVFAWFPKKLQDGSFVWLETVTKTSSAHVSSAYNSLAAAYGNREINIQVTYSKLK